MTKAIGCASTSLRERWATYVIRHLSSGAVPRARGARSWLVLVLVTVRCTSDVALTNPVRVDQAVDSNVNGSVGRVGL